jgi:hypothetical protein
MTHQKRYTSLKPRDPYAALAASDAYCGLQLEQPAVRHRAPMKHAASPIPVFGKRPVPPNPHRCDGDTCGVSRPCCRTGLTHADIEDRRHRFLWD